MSPRPTPTITLDLLLQILTYTFLNPLFAMWVPILILAQQSPSTTPYHFSLFYLFFVCLLSFSNWAQRVWRDRSWLGEEGEEEGARGRRTWVTRMFGGPSLDWDKQIVVITGGASGVGLVVVETLAVMGVTVVVIDRNQFVGDWDDVFSYKCDLADTAQICETVKRIQEEVGHPTILINNAGVVQGKLLVDLTEEDVKQSFDVNVVSHFTLLRLLLPEMIRKRAGHIVTVSSIFGLVGGAQLSDYCATKHSLLGLHSSLRAELIYRHKAPLIRTTLLLPGHISTPLFSSISSPSTLVDFFAPRVEPHEVAKEIIKALDLEQSRAVYLPKSVWAVEVVRGAMSAWVLEGVMWFTGAHEAMRTFRKGGASSLAEEAEKNKDE